MFSLCLCAALLNAQSTLPDKTVQPQTTQTLQERVTQLESEVTELKSLVMQMQSGSPVPALQERPATGTSSVPSSANTEELTSEDAARDKDRATLGFLRDTTISLGLDSYYEYNFNQPVGRVNLLRAYDVLSNNFSLNQASVIFDHPPEVAAGRRWGGRLDLQFGQATDSTQGNPSNEPRPDIYRNIFQAYGTYIFPVGKGLDVDFGKWSSSLGVEGNYTKDQMNYSRSFWFSFLPYYHMGLRATYPVNDRFSLNYWVINGTNQAEATNGFKDELFGFTAKPQKNLTWTVNYYYGQDHPNRAPATELRTDPGAARPLFRCHSARSQRPNQHLRQLCDVAGDPQTDPPSRSRLRD